MKRPLIIKGDVYKDERGTVLHVNNFNLDSIKRIYVIENKDINTRRGWKGHAIENRWFHCSKGKIEIQVVAINEFVDDKPNIDKFILSDKNLDILFVPKGYATLIKQINKGSRVTAMGDFLLGESNDDNLRWESNFFENETSDYR